MVAFDQLPQVPLPTTAAAYCLLLTRACACSQGLCLGR